MKRVIEGVICIILVLFLGCAEEKTGPGNIAGGNCPRRDGFPGTRSNGIG